MGRFKSTKPYWITVKYSGECSRCKAKIPAKADALYFPSTRTMLCDGDNCGKQHQRDMAAADFDESMYGGGF